MVRRILIFVLLLVIGFAFWANAKDVPRVILHQGYLTDTSGGPVNGSVNMSFGIYDVESGGSPLIEEDIGSVEVKDGFYVLEIGKTINLMSIFADKYDLFLEVRINNEALQPRQRIGSVPFAFTAYDVVGDIHPVSISIGDTKIIDENGRWVGDASSIPGVKQITVNLPLTGGTITDTGSIGINKADASTDGYLSKEDFATFLAKQNRVVGVCDVGTCIQKINEDGSVECGICGGGGDSVSITGTNGVVVSPDPITSSGTISLASNYIDGSVYDSRFVNENQVDSITSAMITDGTITDKDLSTGNYTNITGVGTLGSLTVSGNTYLAVSSGSVGIGTASPRAKLDVAGDIKASGQLISGVATGTAPLSVTSTTVVSNLNADMVDGWHASVVLTGDAVELWGTDQTSWVEIYKWRVDFDSVPGNTLTGLGYVVSSGSSLSGRIRFLVNRVQVEDDCTFTATGSQTPLDCPVIKYTKPAGIGEISVEIRKDLSVSGSVYYGNNTLVLK